MVQDDFDEEFKISYCLNKQLSSMDCIHTNYGDIELDDEMQAVVQKELRKILEKRLSELKQNR